MLRSRALLLAAFLTWIAGFVDAVGFLSLDKIYTANMSGNTVAIGIDLTSHNLVETVRRVTPVAGYVIGLLFCRLLVQFGARQKIRSIASLAFACESALLLPVAMVAAPPFGKQLGAPLLFIALLALAMGIQNAALTHFSTLTIYSGFVTGTLVKWMERTAKYLTRLWDEFRKPGSGISGKLLESFHWKEFQLSVWLGLIWVAYIAGAACGAFGKFRFSTRALYLPLLCIVSLILVDLWSPLAVQEEQFQEKL